VLLTTGSLIGTTVRSNSRLLRLQVRRWGKMSSISLYRSVVGTSNKEPMKQCGGDDDEAPKGDMDRALGLSSLGFGMLAALVLAVSVGADYWLLTSEPWPTSSFTGSGGDQSSPDAAAGGGSAPIGMNIPSVVMTETHSGLWQACIFAEIESASTTQGKLPYYRYYCHYL
jgi:hypothetical protein